MDEAEQFLMYLQAIYGTGSRAPRRGPRASNWLPIPMLDNLAGPMAPMALPQHSQRLATVNMRHGSNGAQ